MNAVHLHLLLNHVPVIGTMIAVLLLGYALLRRSQELVRASFGMLVLAAVAAGVVYVTGEPAEETVEELAGVSMQLVERHEAAALAAALLLGGAGLVALAGLLAFRRREGGIPSKFSVLLFVLALLPAGAMAYTANLGGKIRHTEIRSAELAPTRKAGASSAEHEPIVSGARSRADDLPRRTR